MLELTLDLVPKTCFYSNLRKEIPQSKWNKLRKEILLKQGNVCCVCNSSGKLQCHEEWEYDEVNKVQYLIGFKALCVRCHQVVHFGMSLILAEQNYIDPDELVRHFMRVNNVERQVFHNHLNDSMKIWKRRSEFTWRTDFGSWSYLLKGPVESNINAKDELNDYGPSPGDDMPTVCPYCKKEGTLEFIDEENDDEMTDGQHAEYLAGTQGYAACNNCNHLIFFG